MVITLYKTA